MTLEWLAFLLFVCVVSPLKYGQEIVHCGYGFLLLV